MVAAVESPASEADLVSRAQAAVSQCNWEVGECASIWTKRFARGRTDGDFAALVGLSADQVFQRRRVWETFGDVCGNYPALKWSHFYVALTWDDAAECLQWANDLGATVAEMKAWRRAQRGEDLSVPDDQDWSWAAVQPVEVRAPGDAGNGGRSGADDGVDSDRHGADDAEMAPFVAGVARAADPSSEYAPFRDGAAVVPAKVDPHAERPEPTLEQIVKRMASTLERCAAAITDEFSDGFADLPEKDRKRFLKAAERLADKIAALD